jgi:hypothetical protein
MENDNIGFFAVNIKNHKRAWQLSLTICGMAVVGSLLLVQNGITIFLAFDRTTDITTPVLVIFLAVSFIYSWYSRRMLKKLNTYEDFETKLIQYEKIYKTRLVWRVTTCLLSCFLYVLTAGYWFLFFALLELLFSIAAFPNKVIFRKELKNDEIVLV